MLKKNVLSGQVYGKVDWVTANGQEIGMFLRTYEQRAPVRCGLRGAEVERMLGNQLLQKGMMVTAQGEYSARCFQRKDNNLWVSEVLCTAHRIVAESSIEHRLKGSIYANLKGVIMHWDDSNQTLKTYLNPEPGRPETVTCSILIKNWLNTMRPEGRERFIGALRKGREFTTSALIEASNYKGRDNVQVPSLMLLPLDFKLQG